MVTFGLRVLQRSLLYKQPITILWHWTASVGIHSALNWAATVCMPWSPTWNSRAQGIGIVCSAEATTAGQFISSNLYIKADGLHSVFSGYFIVVLLVLTKSSHYKDHQMSVLAEYTQIRGERPKIYLQQLLKQRSIIWLSEGQEIVPPERKRREMKRWVNKAQRRNPVFQ